MDDKLNLFISYTLRDQILNIDHLRSIEFEISQFGTPYIDILHNFSPFPQAYVVQKLKSSDVLLACYTDMFLESPWVKYELFTASKLNIPIIFCDCGNIQSFIEKFNNLLEFKLLKWKQNATR